MNSICKSGVLVALITLLNSASLRAGPQFDHAAVTVQSPVQTSPPASVATTAPAPAPDSADPGQAENLRQRGLLLGLIVLLLGVGVVYRLRRRHQPE